jgi:hypothetical protein
MRELSVRRQLRAIASGRGPIIAGPWLSEVGYEALYWVPFLRWFCDRYRVDRSRLVVVSRGGVHGWYRDFAEHYVELLELFTLEAFSARHHERLRAGEQKQHGIGAFDSEILERVRARPGLANARVCHPSMMFRLLGQFWLGNESLHYVQEHSRYAPIECASIPALPPLPDRYVAMKFYTGKAIPDTEPNRDALRHLVESVAARSPVVMLDTRLGLDEHEDFLFRGIPGVTSLDGWLTPNNNLGVQTAVIQRASRFVGTCGGLVWLAPLLGTETVGVYANDELLTPHLYAARQAYRLVNAATFTALDLRSLDVMSATKPAEQLP